MYIRIISIASVLLATHLAFGHAKKNHSHRSHGAHQHGAVSMGLAFDGLVGQLEIKFPSESLFGFEREAKSEKDKKIVTEAISRLEKNISQMLILSESLGCRFEKQTIEIKKASEKSNHSDTEALFKITCEKSPKETTLNFRFHSAFSRIKTIDAQVVVDDVQKSIKIENDNAGLILKN